MKRTVVCTVTELPPGERRIVDIDGKSIGVFNVHGSFHALRNTCPHQFAPLCLGKVTGYSEPSEVGEFKWSRDGEIVRCPWHAWEFDIKTGKSIFNPHKVRTKTYPVEVEHPEPCGDSEANGTIDADAVETFPIAVEEDLIVLYT